MALGAQVQSLSSFLWGGLCLEVGGMPRPVKQLDWRKGHDLNMSTGQTPVNASTAGSGRGTSAETWTQVSGRA